MRATRPRAVSGPGVAAAIACVTIVGIGLSLCLLVINLVLEARGVSGLMIGLITAMGGLATIIVSPVVPWLVRRLGAYGYELLRAVAAGEAPPARRRKGKFAMAASCVLRRFDDALVLRAPSPEDLARARMIDPDLRVEVLAVPGRRLSEELQDGMSFRYGVVNLGGKDRHDILKRLEDILAHLRFDFAPVSARSASTRRSAPRR